jgi:hypothetical protein
MTKKHFEAIMRIIKSNRTRFELIQELIAYFKKSTPGFNERKFRDGAGV